VEGAVGDATGGGTASALFHVGGASDLAGGGASSRSIAPGNGWAVVPGNGCTVVPGNGCDRAIPARLHEPRHATMMSRFIFALLITVDTLS
jgi:hypothetical protein